MSQSFADKNAFNWDSIPGAADPADPAAGATFTYTVAAGKRARLSTFCLALTSSAVPGNRGVNLLVQRGAANYHMLLPPTASGVCANQTASRTNYYTFAPGLPLTDAADQAKRVIPMPQMDLLAGDIISIGIANMDVTGGSGDQLKIGWTFQVVST